MTKKLIIVLGPTAVGKSDFSIELALKYRSPIISCDSRQIYKEMSIGTAVPSASQLEKVKHYFIQNKSVKELYTAGNYEIEAINLLEKLFFEGHDTLVMTGGSMFYIDAVCNGLDNLPEADLALRKRLTERWHNGEKDHLLSELKKLDLISYDKLDLSNGQRVVRALEVCLLSGKPFSSFKNHMKKKRNFVIEKIGLIRPKEELHDRINTRVISMVENGLVEEGIKLLPYKNYSALKTVGYKEIFDYLSGSISLDTAVEFIQKHTRDYAKRQMTWWKRDGEINWLNL